MVLPPPMVCEAFSSLRLLKFKLSSFLPSSLLLPFSLCVEPPTTVPSMSLSLLYLLSERGGGSAHGGNRIRGERHYFQPQERKREGSGRPYWQGNSPRMEAGRASA